jgi:hypothetical protein
MFKFNKALFMTIHSVYALIQSHHLPMFYNFANTEKLRSLKSSNPEILYMDNILFITTHSLFSTLP